MTTSHNLVQELIQASKLGKLDVVEQLLSLCDPKANASRALCGATSNSHFDVMKVLLPVSDMGSAFTSLIGKKNWNAAERLSSHMPISLLASQKNELG